MSWIGVWLGISLTLVGLYTFLLVTLGHETGEKPQPSEVIAIWIFSGVVTLSARLISLGRW